MSAAPLQTQELSAEPSLERQYGFHELRLVCELSKSLAIGVMIAGALLGYLMWHELSIETALAWYAVLGLITLIRTQVHRRFLAQPRNVSEIKGWRLAVTAGSALSGLVLGIPGAFFVPSTIQGQLLLGGTMLGIAAAAVSSLSPMRWTYVAFLLPFLLPTVFGRMVSGGQSVVIGVGLLLFSVLMLQLTARYRRHYHDLLRLRFENEALATRLSREKEIAELVNRNLQYQVIERERAESSLRAAKAEAEAANRAKSQFLANMSHEVRTPLNAILGMTELLRRTSLDEKQAKFAATVHSAGEQLLSILNDILDLSRVEAGRLRMHKVPFEPRALVQEVIDLMSAQATRKGLALTYDVQVNVPSILSGDPDRLRQILVNLVSNAIKFTPSGAVNVEVTLAPTSQRRARDARQHVVRWSVTDTGPGIHRDQHARLFKPFSQLDDSPTRRHGGTGLGLAICRQLIDAMGGHIDVASETGVGSTFWFEVPFADATPDALAAAPAVTAAELPHFDAHVLVAEDNEVNRTLVIEMLQLLGCTTAVAADGREVLVQANDKTFDLVLMDWHMPELDGLTATRLIRKRNITARNGDRLPIIALTASVMAGDREACLAAGADDYLSKPFTHQSLVQALQRWLQPS